MMSSVRVECIVCGTIDLRPSQLWIVDTRVEFDCPFCGTPEELAHLSSYLIALLLAAGVQTKPDPVAIFAAELAGVSTVADIGWL